MVNNEKLNRKVATRQGVGSSAHMLHNRKLVAVGLRIVQPQIVLILSGRKRVASSGNEVVANAGDVVVLPAGCVVDLENDPNLGGRYEAISVVVDEGTDRAVRNVEVDLAPILAPSVFVRVRPEFRDAVARARHAILNESSLPGSLAHHAMCELSLWLASYGRRLPSERVMGFVDRLRLRLGSEPAADWNAGTAAAAMAVSEATLRRRLAAEQLTFTGLLQEVRLSCAMGLLQATDLAITHIALQSGFKTHSHFSKTFRQRFGVTPSYVRLPSPAGKSANRI